MTAAGTELVWYAAYGSNIATERFAVYLTGGPVPGSPTGRIQHGARDPSLPRDWRPVELPGRLYFAESSRQWGGGGVAFLDLRAPGSALGRAWLITVGQLADVYRQENGRMLGVDDGLDRQVRAVAADEPIETGGTGWYHRLARCGTIDGLAVVTFSSAERRRPDRRPSDAYRSVIAMGLADAWRLSEAAIDGYLTDAGAPASFEA